MVDVDFHSHSIFSLCGVHTVIEMLAKARSIGMKGLAITDHGPALGGRLNVVFYKRLKEPVPEIKLLKGIECNILDNNGKIDCPAEFIPYMDIILLGIHPNTEVGLGIKYYTDILLKAMEKNPNVDIITHLNTTEYEVDFDRIAQNAVLYGMALEVNNSKTLYNIASDDLTKKFITACKNNRCQIAISSDAHTVEEIGCDDSVRPILKELQFPEEFIVNRSAETAFEFVEKRRKNKRLRL